MVAIWFLLVDQATGEPYLQTPIAKVHLDPSADVSDFRDAVKLKHSNKLSVYDSADLRVYMNNVPLNSADPIFGLGSRPEEPIVVVVPRATAEISWASFVYSQSWKQEMVSEEFGSMHKLSLGGYIPFKLGNLLIGSCDISHLYVRSCMVKLWDFLNACNDISLVTGCPGTGKSSLVWIWALYCCATTSVVYVCMNEQSCMASVAYMENSRVSKTDFLEFDTSDSFLIFIKKILRCCDAQICIVDGLTSESYPLIAFPASIYLSRDSSRRIVFVSSVQVDITKPMERIKYRQDKCFVPEIFYTSSWTLDEYLKSCKNEEFTRDLQLGDSSIDVESFLQYKYHYAGGSVRWMFGYSVENVQKSIQASIDRLSNKELVLQCLEGQKCNNAVNHLFQITRFNNRGDPVYILVSQYALQRLINHAGIRLILAAEKLLPYNNSYQGWIFEEKFKFFVRKSLRNSKKVRLVMKNNEYFDLYGEFGEEFQVDFYRERDLSNMKLLDRTFFFPIKTNQKGFDLAFLRDQRTFYFFQCTVSDCHAMNLTLYRDFIKFIRKPIQVVKIFEIVKSIESYVSADPIGNLHDIKNEYSAVYINPEFLIATFDVNADTKVEEDEAKTYSIDA